LIVGSTSFGKGLVQKVFNLPLDTGMTLTMQRYYTPYGRSLQRDYSNGSIYEYYTHTSSNPDAKKDDPAAGEPQESPIETAGGRQFYGGRGVEPDVKMSAPAFSPLRNRLGDEAFFFVRQAVAGQIPGLESYELGKQKAGHTLQNSDFEVNDKVIAAFREFVAKDQKSGLLPEHIDKQMDFVRSHLREEFVTAAYSTELGQQVLLETDPQLLKAAEALPDAKKLAENIRANVRIG
jgi:carboxyl-terminal processing protease